MTHQNVQLGNLCFFIVTTAFFTCLQDFSQADETKTTQRATQQLSVNPNQTDFEVAVNATPESLLNELVPQRSDSPSDWQTYSDALYRCGEPRILCPAIPPPPCHPTQPPLLFDRVGNIGTPTHGPLYNGPCCPRAGSRDDCPWPIARHIQDTFTDYFYSPNYWPK
jgi:hypothetical protein